MATNFPTSLDNSTSLPYPSSGNFTNAPSLAGLNDNQNDALIATQTKLGIGASTPTSGKFLTGTGIGTSAWANTVPAGTVVGTSDSQTLTNKTLTSPTISSPVITNATISTDLITGYTTSNTGTVYGIPVTTGVINTAGTINGASLVASSVTSSALAANSVTNTAITAGNLYASKFYNPYKFRVWGSSSQTVDNTVTTVIIMNNISYDTGSNFNTSTYTFTAPINGFYHFDYRIGHWTNATYNTEVVLFVQGVNTTRGQLSSGTSSNAGSDTIKLNAGDLVKVVGYSSTSQTLNGTSDPSVTYFSGYLVSAT